MIWMSSFFSATVCTEDQRPAVSKATSANTAGSACTSRIRRDTVAAPNCPATITQTHEEELKMERGRWGRRETGSQSRGKESVVQTLVGRQRRGHLGTLACQPEGSHSERPLPQHQLGDEEPDVERGTNATRLRRRPRTIFGNGW